MNNFVKRFASLMLVGLVLISTLIYILSLWEIVNFDISLEKILKTLFVLFIATVIILFIFSVLFKDKDKINDNNDIKVKI